MEKQTIKQTQTEHKTMCLYCGSVKEESSLTTDNHKITQKAIKSFENKKYPYFLKLCPVCNTIIDILY